MVGVFSLLLSVCVTCGLKLRVRGFFFVLFNFFCFSHESPLFTKHQGVQWGVLRHHREFGKSIFDFLMFKNNETARGKAKSKGASGVVLGRPSPVAAIVGVAIVD